MSLTFQILSFVALFVMLISNFIMGKMLKKLLKEIVLISHKLNHIRVNQEAKNRVEMTIKNDVVGSIDNVKIIDKKL